MHNYEVSLDSPLCTSQPESYMAGQEDATRGIEKDGMVHACVGDAFQPTCCRAGRIQSTFASFFSIVGSIMVGGGRGVAVTFSLTFDGMDSMRAAPARHAASSFKLA